MRSRLLAVAGLLLLAAPAGGQGQQREVAYALAYSASGSPTVSIEMRLPRPLPQPQSLVMPRAIPMGYGEQRYDAFVRDVRAFAGDERAVAVEREEGPRWRLAAGTTRVSYRVDLALLERTIIAASDQSRVRDGYLGALGYSIFAYVDGGETSAVRLRIEAPPEWPIFSTLQPRWPLESTPMDVWAADFYALADSQIVMGPRMTVHRLTTTPAPLYLVSYAEGPVDLDRVGGLAATAFTRVAAYFGSVPFAHYTMHHELLSPLTPRHEYGMSMEHLSSSTYYLAATAGLTSASTADDDARVLYNFAHHIAHSWVPKRTYGEGYFPFSWEIAPVLDSIWFAEGFGQYAAMAALAPAMPDPTAYREGVLARRFHANVASAPPFLKRLSLVELSRIASTRYAEDFRTGRLVFARGGLMAAAIDEHIQAQTRGSKSLRDALRFLVDWTARERRGFAVAELAALIMKGTGVDVSGIVERWLRPLPE
jgi:predicted metalloprotease with PDZ domain